MPAKKNREQPKPNRKPAFALPNLASKISPAHQREILGVLAFLLGGLTLVTLLGVTRGTVGELWANLLRMGLGWGAWALPVFAGVAGAFLVRRGDAVTASVAWGRVLAAEILFAVILALLHLFTATPDPGGLASAGNGGGFVGYAISYALKTTLGANIAMIILIGLGVLTIPAILGLNSVRLRAWSDTLAERAEQVRTTPPVIAEPESEAEREPALPSPARPAPPAPALPAIDEPQQLPLPNPAAAPRPTLGTKPPMRTMTAGQTILTPRTRPWGKILPTLDMLSTTNEAQYSKQEAREQGRVIVETLGNFGVPVELIDDEIRVGPTVTQFGLRPGFVERRGTDGQVQRRKISVNRIAALQHDLELALARAPIRIQTPVPGEPIVGIEVPRDRESLTAVSLRGVMEGEEFRRKKTPLRLALGRDVSGRGVAADLGSMPHLLIAGATGSGKSVCINALIACMLFRNSPDDLRLIMVDPKRVELVNFNGIPHLLGAVIVNVDQVVPCLRWLAREMDNRFTLFAKEKVRNVDAFNDKMRKANQDTMPYIVAMIDELADLMLAAPEETEKMLTRLAQMARATGIHLVIATQRPSVDVVTGLIKANFPSRISFAVTSSVDSRVVLDTPGAEKLLGRGDMLYMSSDSSKIARLQGCFVSDEELRTLVDFWKDKAKQRTREMPTEPPWKDVSDAKEGSDDALLEQAIEIAQQYDRTSISFLQRKLGIGYPRAARLMDQLEEHGIVGPDEGGGKARVVLVQNGEVKNFEVEADEVPPRRKK